MCVEDAMRAVRRKDGDYHLPRLEDGYGPLRGAGEAPPVKAIPEHVRGLIGKGKAYRTAEDYEEMYGHPPFVIQHGASEKGMTSQSGAEHGLVEHKDGRKSAYGSSRTGW